MYERFYNLRERPFSLTPDPDYLFLSRAHREGLNHLRYGVESRAGFVVITGEIGCGKTTLLQTVIRGLDQQTSISRLVHTALDSRELIEAVMLDFGLEPAPGLGKPYLLRDLARFLVDLRNSSRLALLVIDEAQNLSESALEEVRMLSNLETEKSKLIQIVLVGQPNLRDMLARRSLEQLRQRVTVSYHLKPMSAEETDAYINHRLRRASIGVPLTFPSGVSDLIYRHSLGVARKVNIIADAVLLFGYGSNKRAIDLPLAHEVLRELGCAEAELRPPAEPFLTPPSAPPPGVSLSDLEPGAARKAAPDPRTPTDRVESRSVDAGWQREIVPVVAMQDAPTGDSTVDRPTNPPVPAPAIRPAEPTPAIRPRVRPTPGPSSPRPAFYPMQRYQVLTDKPMRSEGFWARIRRGVFGIQKPVFED